MKHGKVLWVALGLVLAAATTFGAADSLKSRWRTEDMKVDGAVEDWPALAPIAPKVEAGAANDGNILRLVITTTDPAIHQRLMLGGLMVYLDPKNKKAQTFAIRVPPLGGRPLPGEAPVAQRITYVGVFGPAKDEMHVVELPSTNGIEAAARSHDGTWCIELGLPLRTGEGQPYAPGVAPGQKVIGLGLVTPDPPKPPSDGKRGGAFGGLSGGFGGATYGSGGGAPVPPGGNRDNPNGKPVKVWTTIELAPPKLP
jgi:hypothetical protein